MPKIKLTARKYEGDDKYSWAIFRSDQSQPVVSGLSKPEIPYYKRQIEQLIEEREKNGRTD